VSARPHVSCSGAWSQETLSGLETDGGESLSLAEAGSEDRSIVG
jgi:hypothetical protein